MPRKAPGDELFEFEASIRVNKRMLERDIKKNKDAEKKESAKLLKAMKAGDEHEIHALATSIATYQGQIRKQNADRLNLQHLEVQLRTIRSQHANAAHMVQVSKIMSRLRNHFSPEAVEEAATNLAKQYEDLDVMSSVMSSANERGSAVTAGAEEVERIKRQVADAAGLELQEELGAVPVEAQKAGPSKEEEEASDERLKALRQMA